MSSQIVPASMTNYDQQISFCSTLMLLKEVILINDASDEVINFQHQLFSRIDYQVEFFAELARNLNPCTLIVPTNSPALTFEENEENPLVQKVKIICDSYKKNDYKFIQIFHTPKCLESHLSTIVSIYEAERKLKKNAFICEFSANHFDNTFILDLDKNSKYCLRIANRVDQQFYERIICSQLHENFRLNKIAKLISEVTALKKSSESIDPSTLISHYLYADNDYLASLKPAPACCSCWPFN